MGTFFMDTLVYVIFVCNTPFLLQNFPELNTTARVTDTAYGVHFFKFLYVTFINTIHKLKGKQIKQK